MHFKRPTNKLIPNTHPVIHQLRKIRIEKELTQMAVATATGYSHTQLSYIERQTKNPSFTTIVDIAEYLGYDIVLAPKGPSQ